MTQEARGEVYDLGYQRYDGPREGRFRVRKALWMNALRDSLGIGRGALAWVIPGLLVFFTVSPALLLVTINVLAEPVAEALPRHPEYYALILLVLFIFSAVAAPQALCPDRRDGVIALYLVRPISASDYVVAKWAAIFILMLSVVLAGQTVMFAGLVLAAGDPVEYVRQNWLDVPRFIASGVVIALLLTTVPLAISSFTVRRMIAALMIVGVFFIVDISSGVLTACVDTDSDGCEPLTGEYAPWFALAGFSEPLVYVNNQIFDVTENDPVNPLRDLHPAVPSLWLGLLVAGSGALLLRRYAGVRL